MKKEKLNKVLKKFQVECLNYGWDSLLDAILESVAPEPLDPHTCELMVGDEVEYKGAKCVIFQIKNVYYLVHKLTGTNMSTQYRCEIILLHRNGATIKEIT